MCYFGRMSVLTITDVPDETVAELTRRAAAHGVCVEDEARRVLKAAVPNAMDPDASKREAEGFKQHLLNFPFVADDDLWVFDRHDPRNARPERQPVDLSD